MFVFARTHQNQWTRSINPPFLWNPLKTITHIEESIKPSRKPMNDHYITITHTEHHRITTRGQSGPEKNKKNKQETTTHHRITTQTTQTIDHKKNEASKSCRKEGTGRIMCVRFVNNFYCVAVVTRRSTPVLSTPGSMTHWSWPGNKSWMLSLNSVRTC